MKYKKGEILNCDDIVYLRVEEANENSYMLKCIKIFKSTGFSVWALNDITNIPVNIVDNADLISLGIDANYKKYKHLQGLYK